MGFEFMLTSLEQIMAIKVYNHTTDSIHLNITKDYEDPNATSAKFYDIAAGGSDSWNRTQTQVLTVYRKTTDATEVRVVFPGTEVHIR